MAAPLSRRRALALGAGLAAGAVATGIGAALPSRSVAGDRLIQPVRDLSPVSMAMHIHACFSERTASMQAHLQQAQQTGIDVIWWTEHDFRVQAHGYRQAVRFEGLVELENELEWTWTQAKIGVVNDAVGTFVETPHSPDEPGRALRLSATGPAEEWGYLTFDGEAWNDTYSTCLADTTIELDVLTESIGPDAELVVEIFTSYRPATGGRPAGPYSLNYRVGSGNGRTTEDSGRRGVIAIRGTNGWQRLRLHPVDDIAALWPDLVAGDASLCGLRVAVRARRGAAVSVVVDRLRFTRARRDDQDGLALQAELIEAYASRYPRVRQYQALELSLVMHLNSFGGDLFLPDYGDGPPYKDETVAAAMAMVKSVHAHGGLTSYNHPVASNPAELGRQLIETHNLGADLLEVGSPKNVESVAFGYDIAGRNAIFVTATGVTDDHYGEGWLDQRTRWITNAWSRSIGSTDLVDALSAGRCWFVDPAGWRGVMDISAQGSPAMGGVLVTTDRTVPFEVRATDVPAESTLQVITGLVDRAGTSALEPVNTIVTSPSRDVRGGTFRFDVRPEQGRYVRAVVRDAAGVLVGFSNPTWVLPDAPPGGIPPDRLL